MALFIGATLAALVGAVVVADGLADWLEVRRAAALEAAIADGRLEDALASLPPPPRSGRAARAAVALATDVVAPHAAVAAADDATATRVRAAAKALDEVLARHGTRFPELIARAEPVLSELRLRRSAHEALEEVASAVAAGAGPVQATAATERVLARLAGRDPALAAAARGPADSLVARATLRSAAEAVANGEPARASELLSAFAPPVRVRDPVARVVPETPRAPSIEGSRLARLDRAIALSTEGDVDLAAARLRAAISLDGPDSDAAADAASSAAVDAAVRQACRRLASLALERAAGAAGADGGSAGRAARTILDALACDEVLDRTERRALRVALARRLTDAASRAEAPSVAVDAALTAWDQVPSDVDRSAALVALARLRLARSDPASAARCLARVPAADLVGLVDAPEWAGGGEEVTDAERSAAPPESPSSSR